MTRADNPADEGLFPTPLHQAAAEKQLAPQVQRFTVDVDPLDLF